MEEILGMIVVRGLIALCSMIALLCGFFLGYMTGRAIEHQQKGE